MSTNGFFSLHIYLRTNKTLTIYRRSADRFI